MLRTVRFISIALALLTLAGAATAQPYPSKPIKIVVSTSPGGITDILARFLGAHITAKTGQTVVIDNRAGGSGNIAMSEVSRAAPDGYTFGFANTGNIVINPFLFQKLNYDPLNDLIPVGAIGTVPLFLVSNTARMPAKKLQEFVAYAKANPDKVSYAGAGAGTTPDLAWQRLRPARRLEARGRAAPRHRPGDPGRDRRRRAGDVRLDGAAHGIRQATARCACSAPPRPSVQRTCADVPTFAEQGFPISSPKPGSPCSRRAGRRRRSSIRSTATPAASMTTRRLPAGSAQASSTRFHSRKTRSRRW